jgi:hypothetical protein
MLFVTGRALCKMNYVINLNYFSPNASSQNRERMKSVEQVQLTPRTGSVSRFRKKRNRPVHGPIVGPVAGPTSE